MLKFLTTFDSVDSLTGSLRRKAKRLHALVAKHTDKSRALRDQSDDLLSQADRHHTEAVRAHNVARKISALVGEA